MTSLRMEFSGNVKGSIGYGITGAFLTEGDTDGATTLDDLEINFEGYSFFLIKLMFSFINSFIE